MSTDRQEITRLLLAWDAADSRSQERLWERIYGDLERIARGHLRQERPGHTLEPAALIHEVYMRLIDQTKVDWQNRAHFFGVAARIMRRILVDHARRHLAKKRGGSFIFLQLDETLQVPAAKEVELLAIDEILDGLAAVAPRQSQVVELRFFAGLSLKETADALGVSIATVKADWQMARAWLFREMHR